MNKVIKQVGFSDVHPLVDKSYATFYNNTMRRALGAELIRMFAPMDENKTSRWWSLPSDVKGTFRSIVEAPDEIQGLLAMLWEEKQEEILSKIKNQPSVGDLEKILVIPRQNYIFYTEIPGAEEDVPNQRFRLLITGWACEFGNPIDKGEDVATNKKAEATDKHQKVMLVMVDENHKPIPNARFTYSKEQRNVCHEFETDERGEYNMGPCLINSEFTCEYLLTRQQRSFEVQKNISRYELQFAPFVDATVKVENQHGEPQPNIQITASYGNQVMTVVTDGLGETIIHDLLYQGSEVLMHLSANTQGLESIDVKVDNIASNNHFLLRIQTQDPMQVSLLVLLDGNPVPGYSVRIDCSGNTAIYAADEQGLIFLPFLKDKDVFHATSTQDEQQTKRFDVIYGTNQYVFNVVSPKVEEEKDPEKNPPVEIDPPKQRRFLIVRNCDGKPEPLFTVRLNRNGQTIDMQTDANGRIILPEDWAVGDKFNVIPVSEIPPRKEEKTSIQTKEVYGESDADENNDITIEDGKDEYFYVLPEPDPLIQLRYVLIVDAEDKSVPFYALQISHNEQLLESGSTISDRDAHISLPIEWLDGDWFEAYDPKTNTRQAYQLQPMGLEYIFKLPAAIDEQNVHVRVINQNGLPIGDYPLVIQIDDQVKQGTTDTNGCMQLGNLLVGQHFIVASGNDGNMHQDYLVERGKDEYIFQIVEEGGGIVVQLLDKKESPVPNAQLNLINKRKEAYSHYTDQEGCIEVPRSFFTDSERIGVHVVMPGTKVKDTHFKYEDKYNHYVIRLRDPFPWGCLWRLLLFLLLCLLLLVKCEKDISVIALDGADQPLQGVTVNLKYIEHQLYKEGTLLYNKEHTPTGVTGPDGRYVFEKQPCSVFSWIFYTLQHAYVEGQYGIQQATGTFLFHWRFTDYPLYFFSDAKIKVISSQTGKPLPGASIKLWTTDKSCDSLSLTTANDGTCSFRYSDISANVSKLLATCTGYSGALYQNLPMKTFADSVFVIPLDPPSQCDTEVNNNDQKQGNHAVYDYIMGKNVKGKQFKLDYYTDSAPDHIMVYGGTSAEYSSGNAPLIWEFDGATNTTSYSSQYSVTLTLPSDVICVVVDKGTNWGYYIHCPL